MTSERQAFLDAIAAAPDDVAARNAFSDWLRDRGEEPPGGEVRAFADLRGCVLTDVAVGANKECVEFTLADGRRFRLYHDQNCCERVEVNDIAGDLRDLIGHPLTMAEETESRNENPPGVPKPDYQDSFTWTFYRLATVRGYVTIRWYGESNGYYSESVSFGKA